MTSCNITIIILVVKLILQQVVMIALDFDIRNIEISSHIISGHKSVLSKPIGAEVCYYVIIFTLLDLSGRHEFRLFAMSSWCCNKRVVCVQRVMLAFAACLFLCTMSR